VKGTGFNDKTLVIANRCVVDSAKYINTDSAAPNSGLRYCQVFDAATTAEVTLGTTLPTFVMVAATNTADDLTIGWLGGVDGLVFDRGIVVASTTTTTGNTLASAGSAYFFATIG